MSGGGHNLAAGDVHATESLEADVAVPQTALISAWPAVMRLGAESPSRIRQGSRADRAGPAAVRELILRPDTEGEADVKELIAGQLEAARGSPRSGMATTATAGPATDRPPGPAPHSGKGQLPGGQQVQQTRQKCQFLQPIRCGKPTRSTRREQPKRLVASAVSGGLCAGQPSPPAGFRVPSCRAERRRPDGPAQTPAALPLRVVRQPGIRPPRGGLYAARI